MGVSAFLGSSALLPAGLGFRNAIINGDFRINQRGLTSSGITASGFGYDRWQMFKNGDGTTTMSAQTFALGNAITGQEPRNYLRLVSTGQTTSASLFSVYQNIEDVRTFAGQTATLSYWARAGSGTPRIAIQLTQDFGSGGSASGAVLTYIGQSTLSTSWQRFTHTFTVPSISGKTIGTSLVNTSYLQLAFVVSAGSNFNTDTGSLGIQSNTFDIWGVQFEQNNQATPFEQRPITVELELCQRYYEDSITVVSAAGSYAAGLGGNTYCSPTFFKVTKRIPPSSTNNTSDIIGNIRLWDNTGVAGRVSLYRNGWTTTTTATTDWFGTWGFSLTTTGSTTDAAMAAFRYAYSAEL